MLILEQGSVGKVVDQDVLFDNGGELLGGKGSALEGVVVWGEDRDRAVSRVQLG